MNMTFDDVRQIGLKLPGAEETRYYRMPALKVGDEIFVVRTSYFSAEPNSISVPIGFKQRDELIAANPSMFYLRPHYEPYPVVLVRLDSIKRAELQRLLRAAYEGVSAGRIVPGRRRTTKTRKRIR
jgi:hypothetical protein